MANKEVLFETFFTKAPGQEGLRKTAEGRLRALLKDGWHEMERQPAGPDSVRIRFEREGATKKLPPLRREPEPAPRRGYGGPGGREGGPGGRGGPGGGRGGFGGGGRGGPGGGRGGPGGGRGGPGGGRGGPGGGAGGGGAGGAPAGGQS